jgi:uncharacterized protein (DUF1800 family)
MRAVRLLRALPKFVFVSASSLIGVSLLAGQSAGPGSASAKPSKTEVTTGRVIVLMQPNSGTAARVSQLLSFSLTVGGTTDPAVEVWVNGIEGGNDVVGKAVNSKPDTVLYLAPTVVPTPNTVVTLEVASVVNPQAWAIERIQVMNPIPILYGATPSTFNLGKSTVVLNGLGFVPGAELAVNGARVATTYVSSRELTATVNLTETGSVDLQVFNPGPGGTASPDLVATVKGTPPTLPVEPSDASRFLEQATFGATDADIHHLSTIGYQAWLNEQFNIPQTLHEPQVEANVILANPLCPSSTDVACYSKLFVGNSSNEQYVQDSFWQQALTGDDQLRQRVKYTLNELFVVSSNSATSIGNMPRGEANFLDLLGRDAFGNFRTLLGDVTLDPMMGQFLSTLENDKGNANTDPDENYAREVMQLFTIGLWQLNDDGTQKLDGNGNPIPTYSNNDVMGLAKVFTGFSWYAPGNYTTAWWNSNLWEGPGYGSDLHPMGPFPAHHSTDEKQFLGSTISANPGADPTHELNVALNTIFNHPNLPAFFSRQMIQHLVTSNPSPAYVNRVAQAFKNNGSGVRGDLKAVITAILLDPEARNSNTDFSNPQFGKVRESLLRYTQWARAFTAQSKSGGWEIGSTEDPIWGLGEMTMRSPTVFNWFTPGYVPPSTTISQAGLVAPELQMTNVSTVVCYVNFMQDAIGSNSNGGQDVSSSYAAEVRLASYPDNLLDRINLLLMAGNMSPTLRSQIIDAVNSIAIPSGDPTGSAVQGALALRAQTAIFLTMSSPEYSAQN